VAASRRFAGVEQLNASEIRVYHLAGGAGRVVVPTPANGQNVDEVSFSRDGRHAYYTERVADLHKSRVYVDANHMNFAVMRRDLETGRTVELVRGFGSATTPRVSPDSR